MKPRLSRSSHVTARVIAILALLALLLPSLSTVSAAQEPAGDKVLRIRQPFWPDVIDPQKSSYAEEIAVSSLDYEGLTRFDEDLQTVPAAAESWEFNADGTILTFHLRENLTYSDGSPLTAERFRFAIERSCDPNTAAIYASILFDIVGCEDFYTSLTPPEPSEALPHRAQSRLASDAAYEAAKAALGVRTVDDRDPGGAPHAPRTLLPDRGRDLGVLPG